MSIVVINADDTLTHANDGDEFTTTRRVSGRQWELLEEAVQAECLAMASKLGQDIGAEVEKADESDEDVNALDFDAPALRRFRFQAVAVSFKLADKLIRDTAAVLNVYDECDKATKAWVDERVMEVWKDSDVPKAKKKPRKS